jgi:hypothetical protein
MELVELLKYLAVWLVSSKRFRIDAAASSPKFLGFVLGILRKCGGISHEIK